MTTVDAGRWSAAVRGTGRVVCPCACWLTTQLVFWLTTQLYDLRDDVSLAAFLL